MPNGSQIVPPTEGQALKHMGDIFSSCKMEVLRVAGKMIQISGGTDLDLIEGRRQVDPGVCWSPSVSKKLGSRLSDRPNLKQ